MDGYLIYHPKRIKTEINGLTIYHDSTIGNQDPYIWNDKFLHSYCHITQIKPEVGHTIFWVSGDTFPKFNHLYCDLVFVVAEKLDWKNRNSIEITDKIIDSTKAYNDHYRWVKQHYFKRRRRFTLKADPKKSYQPQNQNHKLLDLLPVLTNKGLSLVHLQNSMRAGFSSQPLWLSQDYVEILLEWLDRNAIVKHRGSDLTKIRRLNAGLGSPWTEKRSCC